MKIRMATTEDKPRLAEMIAKDPYHAGKLTPEFFLGEIWDAVNSKWLKDPTIECAAVEDDDGTVFYVRYNRAFRMSIQFDKDLKFRNRKSLLEAFPVFKNMAKTSGFKEIVFDSESPALVAFTKKRMGFKASPDYVLPI